MSHNKERREKNCLNCQTTVHGRFCHVCGQENIETKESFISLTKHFIYDILHFDGKFFYTLKYLFIRPGYVARQYTEGKRASFLHPIRMYLFSSAICFLFLFSLQVDEVDLGQQSGRLTQAQRLSLAKRWQKRVDDNPADTVFAKRLAILKDSTQPVDLDSLHWRDEDIPFSINDKVYHNVEQYYKEQDMLPEKEKDGWIERKLVSRSIQIGKRYKNSAK